MSSSLSICSSWISSSSCTPSQAVKSKGSNYNSSVGVTDDGVVLRPFFVITLVLNWSSVYWDTLKRPIEFNVEVYMRILANSGQVLSRCLSLVVSLSQCILYPQH